jgi:alpha-glucosidase
LAIIHSIQSTARSYNSSDAKKEFQLNPQGHLKPAHKLDLARWHSTGTKNHFQEANIDSSSHPDWLKSIHHDGSSNYLSELYPKLGERVYIRLRVMRNAPILRVYLRHFPDGEQAFIAMQPIDQHHPGQWWECKLEIKQPVVHYRFVLECTEGIWWYSAAGPSLYDPLDFTDFQILADYQPPVWVHNSVFYQIFPDRFANGDATNDPQPQEFEIRGFRPKTFSWGEPPAPDTPFPMVFYGGDLQGIQQRLDYLDSLGINALYLNPIFTAHSNHKYDVIDYDHVDPHFGGDQALINLRNALSQRNMRYILDVVPNHCGYWHPWFQHARQHPDSVEAGFFTFDHHPDHYASWLGVWSLPKLNYSSPELRRRIYQGSEAVFRRWLRHPYAADGWRVDVANMLGRQGPIQMGSTIAREIRTAVKESQPEAYLIGENFFDATSQLQGDQWDGVMNYAGLTMPLWHWLRGYQQGAWGLKGTISGQGPWPTAALEASLRHHLAVIPWAIALQQLNLLGSHDTSRIRSIVGGNPALHQLAAVIQFTFPGVPCVYYGDEIGLEDDPVLASRGCMPWNGEYWDQATNEFYRSLIQLRRTSPALQAGGFQVLSAQEDLFVYQREAGDERLLVAALRGQHPHPAAPLAVAHGGIPDGSRFREYFSGAEAEVRGDELLIPEQQPGAAIWIQV